MNRPGGYSSLPLREQCAVIDIMTNWRDYGECTKDALVDLIEQILLKPEHAGAETALVIRACMEQAGFPPLVGFTLDHLAREIDAALRRDQAKLARERMELELKTKRRPRVEQAPPQGLFEQTQEQLFPDK
jgi:hypothetical protein